MRSVRKWVWSACFCATWLASSARAQVAPPAPRKLAAAPVVPDGTGRPVERGDPRQPPAALPLPVSLHGYLQPQLGAQYRADALPRDKWQFGALSSRAGLIVAGEPIEHWSYVVHLSLDARTLGVVVDASLVDQDGDGSAEGVALARRATVGTVFEEVSASYDPFSWITFKAGAMRMPFTVALSSANTNLMFPNRPGANEVFQSGSDQGGLVHAHFLKRRIEGSVGVFNGASLESFDNRVTARGLAYSVRVDAKPLGQLPAAEIDFTRGSFVFGVGAGLIYRPGTLYDRNGYALSERQDLRVAGSLRLAGYGAFVQAEVFRTLQTDNVAARPEQSSGGYAQISYFVPLSRKVGLAPVARAGFTVREELTLPRRVLYVEGGLALFPRIDQPRPEAVRVLVQYLGEQRLTEEQAAHGVVSSLQLLF